MYDNNPRERFIVPFCVGIEKFIVPPPIAVILKSVSVAAAAEVDKIISAVVSPFTERIFPLPPPGATVFHNMSCVVPSIVKYWSLITPPACNGKILT